MDDPQKILSSENVQNRLQSESHPGLNTFQTKKKAKCRKKYALTRELKETASS